MYETQQKATQTIDHANPSFLHMSILQYNSNRLQTSDPDEFGTHPG